jgi:hypothetical protein
MGLPDTFPIHVFIIILCIPAFIILLRTLRKLKYAGIMVTLIVSLLLLVVNIGSFSAIYIIDRILNDPIDIYFYNYWSLFLRTHASATILLLAYQLMKGLK